MTAANDATLTGTEANVIPSPTMPQAVAGVTTADCQSSSAAAGTAAAILDGTTTAADLFLNFVVDDTDHDVTGTPCNLIVNGTIDVVYILLGDY